ncbi:MAG: hypothetical protein J6U54_18870 [Clostridiales bacterium]|nr:hypothetical protein [Clostridiales bacterium]
MAVEQENSKRNIDAYITTTDNPYDPRSQYEDWEAYDQYVLGYCTNQRLARTIDYLKDTLKNDNKDELYNLAILELIRLDPLNVYTLVLGEEKKEKAHASEEEEDFIKLVSQLDK